MVSGQMYKHRKIRRSRLVPVPSEVHILLPYEKKLLAQKLDYYQLPENCGSTPASYQDKEESPVRGLLTSGFKATPEYQRCRNCRFWRVEDPDGWDPHETGKVTLCGSFKSDYFNLAISPGHYCRYFATSDLHQELHDLLWEHEGDTRLIPSEDEDEEAQGDADVLG